MWPQCTHIKENSAVQPVLGSVNVRSYHLLVGLWWALVGWCFLICKLVLPKLFFFNIAFNISIPTFLFPYNKFQVKESENKYFVTVVLIKICFLNFIVFFELPGCSKTYQRMYEPQAAKCFCFLVFCTFPQLCFQTSRKTQTSEKWCTVWATETSHCRPFPCQVS